MDKLFVHMKINIVDSIITPERIWIIKAASVKRLGHNQAKKPFRLCFEPRNNWNNIDIKTEITIFKNLKNKSIIWKEIHKCNGITLTNEKL